MARAAASDSEPESTRSSVAKTQNRYSAKKTRRASAASPEIDDVETNDAAQPESEEGDKNGGAGEGEDEDGDDEPEYEIEAILKAKRGFFHPGRMAYFVKWVGYGDEHNSWVDEPDAGNAEELIQQYWREQKVKTGPSSRKSIGDRSSAKDKKNGRASYTLEESSDGNDSAAPPKKRGRVSKAGDAGVRAKDESVERAAKKARRSTTGATTGKKGKSKADAMKVDGDEEDGDGMDKPIGSMESHMKTQSWESLVKSVDTVERDDDGTIYVYFTINGEEDCRMRESSKLCSQRFPRKLIKFYESNLRWRTNEDDDVKN